MIFFFTGGNWLPLRLSRRQQQVWGKSSWTNCSGVISVETQLQLLWPCPIMTLKYMHFHLELVEKVIREDEWSSFLRTFPQRLQDTFELQQLSSSPVVLSREESQAFLNAPRAFAANLCVLIVQRHVNTEQLFLSIHDFCLCVCAVELAHYLQKLQQNWRVHPLGNTPFTTANTRHVVRAGMRRSVWDGLLSSARPSFLETFNPFFTNLPDRSASLHRPNPASFAQRLSNRLIYSRVF